MKITNDDLHINGYPADKTARKPENPLADFNSILENTLAKTTAAEKEVQPPAVIEKAMTVNLQHMRTAQQPSTIDQIENMLDLLDEYRYKLADPNSTLKDIHPLVKSMETANKKLKPVLDSIDESDQLKQILNQTLVTTSLEVFKFNKGEYL